MNRKLQKITEELNKLKQSEHRYKRLVEGIPGISYIFGTKTGAKYWSPQVEAVLGISPSTLVKDPFAWFNSIHPDDQKEVRTLFLSLNKRKSFSIEYRIKDTKGNWHWLNDRTISVKRIKDEYLIEGLAQDITDKKETEQELVSSEKKFRKAFMTSPDSININRLDDGTYVSINSGFTKIMGYTEKDAIGKTSLELNIWERESDRNNLVSSLKKNGLVENLDTSFCAKDGSIKYGLMSASLIDLNGIPHILSITRDVTERKYFEEALQYSEEKYRLIVERANDGIEISQNDKIIYSNKRFAEILGYTLEEIKNISFDQIFTDEAKIDLEKRQILRQKGETIPNQYETTFVSKNGKIITASVNYQIIDYNGKPATFAIIHDISKAKQMENDLRLSEEKYRLIVENANDGIVISQKNQFIYSNNRFAQMLGYSVEELNNISFKEIYTKEATKSLYNRLNKRDKGETIPNQYETTFKKKDGNIIIVSVNYQIIDFQNEDATFAIIRDITEQKHAEKSLKEALTKAKEADHLKSAFLANMSHEVRTPMNGIMGFARLLRKKNLSGEKQEQYLDVIEKSSERMLNIINDLIDISKIESGQMELHSENMNINDVITFIQRFFEPECASKGIELISSTTLPPDLAIIVSDKDKLEAILINLLKNAIKFTHHGKINFGYEQYEDKLIFFVEDTGIGIPQNKQKQIFDRFIQVDSSMTKPYEGAGLGLSISKAFVNMLGGNLELSSKVNSGSRFYFSIQHVTPIENKDQNIKLKKNSTSLKLSKHDLKIIIAEDDEPSFLYLNILMQPFCKTIIHARNGAQCIELSKKHQDTDLILMDVKMPLVGGYEATKSIRTFNQDVIIVAQTAYAFSDDQNKILESGCNDYITKPIQEEDLNKLIDKYFSK